MSTTQLKPVFLKKLLTGIAWVSAGSFLIKLLGFCTTIVVFRRFSLHEYGTYQLVLSFGSLLGLLMLVGIDEVFVAEGAHLRGIGEEERAKNLGKSYFILRCFLALGVFMLSQVAEYIFGGLYSKDILRLLALYGWTFLLMPFERIIGFDNATRKKFKTQAIYQLAQEGVRVLIVFSLFFVNNLTASTLIMSLVGAMLFINSIFVPRVLSVYWHASSDISIAWSFIKKMGPWVIAQKLLRQGEKNLRPFIIQSVLGREAVAIWSFVEKVYTYTASVFPIDDVLMPMVAGDRSDRTRLREILYRGIRYTVPFYAAMSVFVALMAKPIVQIAFPQYLEAMPSVYVICAYIPFIGVAYILTSYYVSHQEQRRAFWLVAFRLCLMAVLLPISAAFFGSMGVAIEFVASVSIYNILRLRTLLTTFPELQTTSKKILTVDEIDRAFFKRLRYFFLRK